MSRGIIMEYRGSKAIVLTPTGEFKCISLPAGKYDIGEEIEFQQRTSFNIYRWGAVAALLVLALLTAVLAESVMFDKKVYAYVQVDINPSAEFIINKNSRIIDAVPLNSEGERILAGIKFQGKKLEQGIEYFIKRSYEDGLLQAQEESHIILTTIVEGDKEGPPVDREAVQAIKRVIEEKHIPAKLSNFTASREIRDEAKKAGISGGKYLILLQARREGVEIDVEDIKGQSINTAVKKAGGNIGNIIRELAKRGKDEQKMLLKEYKEKIKQQIREERKDNKNKGKPTSQEAEEILEKEDGVKGRVEKKDGVPDTRGKEQQKQGKTGGEKEKEAGDKQPGNGKPKETVDKEKREDGGSQQEKAAEKRENQNKEKVNKGSQKDKRPDDDTGGNDKNKQLKGSPGKGTSKKRDDKDKSTVVQHIIMSLFD